MNTVQIICVIGIALVMFILGRKSIRTKWPIAGKFEFDDDETPTIVFNMKFDQIHKEKYVVFIIRDRINDVNERLSK